MEAIAALGLACNVMQVISFSLEVISVAKQVATSGAIEPDLADRASRLSELSSSLDESLSGLPTPLAPPQHELKEVAQKCCSASLELRDELNKLAPKGRHKVVRILGSSVKSVMRKNSIKKLEKSMLQWQGILDSGLMIRIW